mmetsp:Transcript_3961/g.5891  ORF Transcript_3961/g.5891 Transcript_3961/m.5891 type:complete len:111 (-) Transcript_3961:913-1245(-)
MATIHRQQRLLGNSLGKRSDVSATGKTKKQQLKEVNKNASTTTRNKAANPHPTLQTQGIRSPKSYPKQQRLRILLQTLPKELRPHCNRPPVVHSAELHRPIRQQKTRSIT